MSGGFRPECVITGCALVSGPGWLPVDVHRLADVFIINAPAEKAWQPLPSHYDKLVEITGNYFERKGVFVAHEDRVLFNAAALEYMERSPR